MSEDLRALLMGYLDGELDAAGRARVEDAMRADPGLRREYEEMRKLKELTAGLAPDARSDAELEVFWAGVYNRLERHTAWALLLTGFAGVVAAGAYLVFTHPWPHVSVKVAGACGLLGALLMLVSVWRERRRLLPHDRYHREVRR
jgi:anti-sigma factor RsiW